MYVLSDLGEDLHRLWVRGRVLEGSAFWSPRIRPASDAPGRLVRAPQSWWWTHVVRRDGRAGWVDMTRAPMAGTDACSQ